MKNDTSAKLPLLRNAPFIPGNKSSLSPIVMNTISNEILVIEIPSKDNNGVNNYITLAILIVRLACTDIYCKYAVIARHIYKAPVSIPKYVLHKYHEITSKKPMLNMEKG